MTRTLDDRVHRHDHHDHDHHDHDHHHHDGEGHHHHGGGQWEAGEAPPEDGPVVLDIGAGFGALIVHLPDDRYGSELHVRPSGAEGNGATTHTGVWRRSFPGGSAIVAVFPELPVGRWVILAPAGSASVEVEITDGGVNELILP